jgi:hypothetical protein
LSVSRAGAPEAPLLGMALEGPSVSSAPSGLWETEAIPPRVPLVAARLAAPVATIARPFGTNGSRVHHSLPRASPFGRCRRRLPITSAAGIGRAAAKPAARGTVGAHESPGRGAGADLASSARKGRRSSSAPSGLGLSRGRSTTGCARRCATRSTGGHRRASLRDGGAC